LSYNQPLRIAVGKKKWRGKVRTRKGEVLYGVVGRGKDTGGSAFGVEDTKMGGRV
jgi:hypothetical protein